MPGCQPHAHQVKDREEYFVVGNIVHHANARREQQVHRGQNPGERRLVSEKILVMTTSVKLHLPGQYPKKRIYFNPISGVYDCARWISTLGFACLCNSYSILIDRFYSMPHAVLVIVAKAIIADSCFLSELLSIKNSKCSPFLVTFISASSSAFIPSCIRDSVIQNLISDLLLLLLRIQTC